MSLLIQLDHKKIICQACKNKDNMNRILYHQNKQTIKIEIFRDRRALSNLDKRVLNLEIVLVRNLDMLKQLKVKFLIDQMNQH